MWRESRLYIEGGVIITYSKVKCLPYEEYSAPVAINNRHGKWKNILGGIVFCLSFYPPTPVMDYLDNTQSPTGNGSHPSAFPNELIGMNILYPPHLEWNRCDLDGAGPEIDLECSRVHKRTNGRSSFVLLKKHYSESAAKDA